MKNKEEKMEASTDLYFDILVSELVNEVHKPRKRPITNMAEWLRLLLSEIEKAEELGLQIIALVGALIIPDLCGHIEYVNEAIKSCEKYNKWTRNYIYPISVGHLKDGSLQTGYEDFLFRRDYLYQLRCFLFHEGIPGLNEKYTASRESCSEYVVDDFKFTLVLDGEIWTGANGYIECPQDGNLTTETKRKVEVAVRARETCRIICAAAQKYLDENEEKFAEASSFRAIDNR